MRFLILCALVCALAAVSYAAPAPDPDIFSDAWDGIKGAANTAWGGIKEVGNALVVPPSQLPNIFRPPTTTAPNGN